MKVKVNVSKKQYVRLLFSLTYQKPIMRVLLCVAILLAAWLAFFYLGIFNLPEPKFYQFITLGLITVVQPTVIYYTIRTNYNSSNYLSETLDIEITHDRVKIRGESFFMEILSEKLFKIVEKPKWFLMYQNSLSAIIIPKKELTDNEVNEMREILKGVKDVPSKLLT